MTGSLAHRHRRFPFIPSEISEDDHTSTRLSGKLRQNHLESLA